ncbi:MAG TPA: tetratricopeptide repeat protein [Ferrovibrio sp.]|jgi:tetratricopeptide (TPR) repeat protein|uniref:tetratricopeptide repeat protein n=1 Tax=Ferrovibrio sp. TaxID=1917215 RepID=UPI002B4B4EF0|nr:tetratricopeptide repeat protein [Ferrovibrio sp.]HLT75900.1 tetratricopeptide repeat protein [Ferrovibrio sp.]
MRLLPVLAVLLLAAAPARAQQAVDSLFEKLYETQNPIEARQLERKIWEAWAASGSDTIDALMKGGMAVMETGDHARAEQIFTSMIELKPDFAEAYNKRATVRFLTMDYAGSVADIERTLQLEPRHFGALAGLGTIMEQLDNLEEALRAYRRALAANPHLPDASEKLKELRRRLDAREL